MPRYGCFYVAQNAPKNEFLPQVELDVKATLFHATARTTITQTFVNQKSTSILEVFYTFPLHANSRMVGFSCHVEDEAIHHKMKLKQKADFEDQDASSKEQATAISDSGALSGPFGVFQTLIGTVPANSNILIKITVVQELEQDTQNKDNQPVGTRYIVPAAVAPNYGQCQVPNNISQRGFENTSIEVDIIMEKGLEIHSVVSPSHFIEVAMGRTCSMAVSAFEPCCASVKLPRNTEIYRDVVLIITPEKPELPFAFLETHPTLPDQRALMVSFAPKLHIPPTRTPLEIVFIVDQSESMEEKIPILKLALNSLLKSLPQNVFFNIIYCGATHKALWPRSRVCEKENIKIVMGLLEPLNSVKESGVVSALRVAVNNKWCKKTLEVIVLSDGQFRDQKETFAFVEKSNQEMVVRYFTVGIGGGISSAVISELARLGKGFSQSVYHGEDFEKPAMRMIQDITMPRLTNVTLDYNTHHIGGRNYSIVGFDKPDKEKQPQFTADTVPLFKESSDEGGGTADLGHPLPTLRAPGLIQGPETLPPLYPSARCTIYSLSSRSIGPFPEKVTVCADSEYGSLELDIPVQKVGKGEAIHQLAAEKIMFDLKHGNGWIHTAQDSRGKSLKDQWGNRLEELAQRECEQLRAQFQICGDHRSFLVVTSASEEKSKTDTLLRRVLNLQTPDGFWDWNDNVLGLVGPALTGLQSGEIQARMKACYASTIGDGDASDLSSHAHWTNILATFLVGKWLEAQAADSQQVWHLWKQKADSWMDGATSQLDEKEKCVVRSLMAELASFF